MIIEVQLRVLTLQFLNLLIAFFVKVTVIWLRQLALFELPVLLLLVTQLPLDLFQFELKLVILRLQLLQCFVVGSQHVSFVLQASHSFLEGPFILPSYFVEVIVQHLNVSLQSLVFGL